MAFIDILVKIKNMVIFLKNNWRKILENITSYLAILVGFCGVLITNGAGIGLSPKVIATIVTVSAVANRILTYIRVTFLKNNPDQLTDNTDTTLDDDFLME